MTNTEDEFLFDKRDFTLNCLTLGVAIEVFSRASGHSPDECMNFLIQQAEKRMTRQTPESMEELINQYHLGKQNRVKAIVVKSA
jgi:hypothetical protein